MEVQADGALGISATIAEERSERRSIVHAYKVYLPELDGGVPTVIQLIAAGLSPRWNTEVVTARVRGWGRRDTVDGVAVRRSMSLGTFWSLPLAPTYLFLLWRRSRRAHILALHDPFPLADLVVFVLPRRTRLVVYWHAEIIRQRLALPLLWPLIRRVLARADRIVVSHERLITNSRLLAPFLEKVRVVPFGVDAATWGHLDAGDREAVSAIRAQRPRLVVALGRLVGYKGFETLVQAMAEVDGQLVICGDGPDRQRLMRRIQALGIADRVSLAGRLPFIELKRLMHAARAFVLPSTDSAETFGIAQLEAMACGLPVINTDLPTATPTVARDGYEGLTAPIRNPRRLAAAINRLLDDPALAEKLGAAGKARVDQHYGLDAFIEATDRLFGELAD